MCSRFHPCGQWSNLKEPALQVFLEDIPEPASAGFCARWLLLRYRRQSGQKSAEYIPPQREDDAQTVPQSPAITDTRHRHKTTIARTARMLLWLRTLRSLR